MADMTTQTEALKLALQQKTESHDVDCLCSDCTALDDLDEALAQPEQEPVGEAYLCDRCHTPFDGAYECPSCGHGEATKEPVYTIPPQRKPLTVEMVLAGARALAKRHADSCGLDFDDVWKYYAEEHKDDAKAVIEAAHGIKGGA